MKWGQGAKADRGRLAFKRKFQAEMSVPDNAWALDLLAALFHQADFSVGC
jgi:hypothetical protein